MNFWVNFITPGYKKAKNRDFYCRFFCYYRWYCWSVTNHSFEALVPTDVRCRRRPKRRPCAGEVFAFLNEETGMIQWNCFTCRDSGISFDRFQDISGYCGIIIVDK